jgi:hypothetical protein
MNDTLGLCAGVQVLWLPQLLSARVIHPINITEVWFALGNPGFQKKL